MVECTNELIEHFTGISFPQLQTPFLQTIWYVSHVSGPSLNKLVYQEFPPAIRLQIDLSFRPTGGPENREPHVCLIFLKENGYYPRVIERGCDCRATVKIRVLIASSTLPVRWTRAFALLVYSCSIARTTGRFDRANSARAILLLHHILSNRRGKRVIGRRQFNRIF